MTFKPQVPKLREAGFIRLRSGIWQHIKEGRITGIDFNVYCTLQQFAEWSTGICVTTADSLGASWQNLSDSKDKKETVQNSLRRLRENGYINYPEGSGRRGPYPVLIDKYEPTVGAAVGWQLNVNETTDVDNPIYDYVSPTPYCEAYGEYYSQLAVRQAVSTAVLKVVGTTVEPVVSLPLQDITKMFIDVFKPFKNYEDVYETLQPSRSDESGVLTHE